MYIIICCVLCADNLPCPEEKLSSSLPSQSVVKFFVTKAARPEKRFGHHSWDFLGEDMSTHAKPR